MKQKQKHQTSKKPNAQVCQHQDDHEMCEKMTAYVQQMVNSLPPHGPEANLLRLLLLASDHFGWCHACQIPMFWMIHSDGTGVPYTAQGVNHHDDCKGFEEKSSLVH